MVLLSVECQPVAKTQRAQTLSLAKIILHHNTMCRESSDPQGP